MTMPQGLSFEERLDFALSNSPPAQRVETLSASLRDRLDADGVAILEELLDAQASLTVAYEQAAVARANSRPKARPSQN